jgi:hypothetical protein
MTTASYRFLPVLLLIGARPLAGQMGPGPGCCGSGVQALRGAPVVELKGKVSRLQLIPGQGMPSVTIKTESGESQVILGSMRYLMAQGFSPKVGDEILVKAYKTDNGLFAASVTLPGANKTLRLRDESGRPLWAGGPRR